MNKVILIGRLTRDPEMRYSENSNIAIARYTLAVNRSFKQDGGQEADFIPTSKGRKFTRRKLQSNVRNFWRKEPVKASRATILT